MIEYKLDLHLRGSVVVFTLIQGGPLDMLMMVQGENILVSITNESHVTSFLENPAIGQMTLMPNEFLIVEAHPDVLEWREVKRGYHDIRN